MGQRIVPGAAADVKAGQEARYPDRLSGMGRKRYFRMVRRVL
jgi:hypothetical protein